MTELVLAFVAGVVAILGAVFAATRKGRREGAQRVTDQSRKEAAQREERRDEMAANPSDDAARELRDKWRRDD